jgi:hypothetical protein
MNKSLENLVIEQDLSIKELADDVCDIVIEHFGKHTYKYVRDIVNKRLDEIK